MSSRHLSAEDEALLILEYLENEQLPRTFLQFLDESKHLQQLRSYLYENYPNNEKHLEVYGFQKFFNYAKQINCQTSEVSSKSNDDLLFDEDFLDHFMRQTPPIESTTENSITCESDRHRSVASTSEQIFPIVSTQPVYVETAVASSSVSNIIFPKCIVVTQDLLPSIEIVTNTLKIRRRRRRRTKVDKENFSQPRKLMPRISPNVS